MNGFPCTAGRLARAALALFAFAIAASPAARATVSDADRAMIQGVFDRLAAASTRPDGIPQWPPELGFIDEQQFNAFATFDNRDGKPVPVVKIYAQLIDQCIEGKADRAALVLGHELGHHVLGHTRKKDGGTPLLVTTFTRDQELAADLYAMQLLLKAGFSYKGSVTTFRRWIDLGQTYSSFEGMGTDHPAPTDRLAALDKEQASLWRAMGAFDSGVYFLLTQQYALAERSFRYVTKEFPDASEAWANLGYAVLMQYADALDPSDLRKFDLGQIVVGGFYRRPASLSSKVRGINEDMWWEAVGALREALRLNPGLALAKANLGVAYLIGPQGKEPGKAIPLLEDARTMAEKDASLDAGARLALAVNLAVAYGAGGKGTEFETLLAAAEKAAEGASESEQSGLALARSAITYNRAFASAASADGAARQEALKQLERYLRTTSPSVAWWSLAYDRYAALCTALGAPARSREALLERAPTRLRQVSSIEVQKGLVAIGDALADVQKRLGPGVVAPVVAGTNLVRVSYPERGIDLLATDQVIAIQLLGAARPAGRDVHRGPRGRARRSRAVVRLPADGRPQREVPLLFRDRPRGTRPEGRRDRAGPGDDPQGKSALAAAVPQETMTMPDSRKWSPALAAAAVLLALAVVPAQAAGRVEVLLNEVGVPSADVGDGVRKAVIELEGKSETALVRTQQLGNDPANDKLKVIQIIFVITRIAEDAKPSAAALAKINEYNVNLTIGKVAVWPGAVVYTHDLWYSTADAETFGTSLVVGALNAASLREALAPFFSEE